MNKDAMRIFDVYHHPRYGFQAVRRGFSWTAFLLPSVWAVRRGLGITTLILVIATTMMFDMAKLFGEVVSNPVSQIVVLLALAVLVGARPGFVGYRWHARTLEEESYELKCTVAATSTRQAVKAAANDDYINGPIRMAAN